MAVHIEFKSKSRQIAENGGGQVPSQRLAAWLRTRLVDTGIEAASPTMHDWGYEIHIHARGGEYYAGVPSKVDRGNLHVFVEKRLTIRDRVLGRVTPVEEPMAQLIKEIIAREPDFRLVRVEQRQ